MNKSYLRLLLWWAANKSVFCRYWISINQRPSFQIPVCSIPKQEMDTVWSLRVRGKVIMLHIQTPPLITMVGWHLGCHVSMSSRIPILHLARQVLYVLRLWKSNVLKIINKSTQAETNDYPTENPKCLDRKYIILINIAALLSQSWHCALRVQQEYRFQHIVWISHQKRMQNHMQCHMHATPSCCTSWSLDLRVKGLASGTENGSLKFLVFAALKKWLTTCWVTSTVMLLATTWSIYMVALCDLALYSGHKQCAALCMVSTFHPENLSKALWIRSWQLLIFSMSIDIWIYLDISFYFFEIYLIWLLYSFIFDALRRIY